jgi:tryptophan halogenase
VTLILALRAKDNMKVVIVGGGVAGWYIAHSLQNHTNCDITIIDTDRIKKLPVGETLDLDAPNNFRNLLRLGNEYEWMKEIGAIYKFGSLYNNMFEQDPYSMVHWDSWNTNGSGQTGEFSSNNMLNVMVYLIKTGKLSHDQVINSMNAGSYFVRSNVSPFVNGKLEGLRHYSYNLDSDKFAEFLKKRPRTKISHINKFIKDVTFTDGNVDKIVFEDDTILTSDLFIDASGFSRVIAKRHPLFKFNTLEHSYNNTAVVVPTKYKDPEFEMRPNVTFNGYENGWGFKINLYHRIGNGILFNDSVVDVEDARKEFLSKIDETTLLGDPKTIKWESGFYETPLINNLMVMGQAAGFIEPWNSNLISRLSGEIYGLFGFIKENKREEYNSLFRDRIKQITEIMTSEFTTNKFSSKYWNWFKSGKSSKIIYENLNFQKYSNLKFLPFVAPYYRMLISRKLSLDCLDLPIPNSDQIQKTINYLEMNTKMFDVLKDKQTQPYYLWLKENVYNGITSEDYLMQENG